MLHLDRTPLRNGYTVTLRSAGQVVEVRGGNPRSRTDMDQPSHEVRVAWSLPGADFDAFMAFYERVVETNESFQVDLLVEDFSLRPHVCKFVPGSVRATQDAEQYAVTATLQAEPLTDIFTAEADNSFMDVYEEYGDEAEAIFALLASLVNEDLPA
jgi:hypothetical protein